MGHLGMEQGTSQLRDAQASVYFEGDFETSRAFAILTVLYCGASKMMNFDVSLLRVGAAELTRYME